MAKSKIPVVAIPANFLEFRDAPSHIAKNTYIHALMDVAKCLPIIIPAIGKKFDLKNIAGRIDGILLPGATSNVCPSNYGADREFDEEDLDVERDKTNLPLIRAAIKMDIPLFAICRGFQELNVACGGTLHQHVENLPGKLDHRRNKALPLNEQFLELRHKVHVQKGGIFEKLGLPKEFKTNSLHQQGVNKLGKGLRIEGISEDGIVEAVSYPKKRFVMGVQWHPEADYWLNPSNKKLFEAFAKVLHGKKRES